MLITTVLETDAIVCILEQLALISFLLQVYSVLVHYFPTNNIIRHINMSLINRFPKKYLNINTIQLFTSSYGYGCFWFFPFHQLTTNGTNSRPFRQISEWNKFFGAGGSLVGTETVLASVFTGPVANSLTIGFSQKEMNEFLTAFGWYFRTGLKQSLSTARVQSIQIGGRNLLKNTKYKLQNNKDEHQQTFLLVSYHHCHHHSRRKSFWKTMVRILT